MKHKKRWLALMAAVCMAAMILPPGGFASAGDGQQKGQATPGNAEEINHVSTYGSTRISQVTPRTTPLDLTAASVSYAGAGGAAGSFDPRSASVTVEQTGEGWGWNHQTNELTLAGARITASTGEFGMKAPDGTVILLAEGTASKITGPDNAAGNSYGFDGAGAVTIKGSGEAEWIGGKAPGNKKFSCGINAKGDVAIHGSSKVIVKTGTDSRGIGIFGGNLLIQEQAVVEVTCGQGGDNTGLSSGEYTGQTGIGDIEIKGNAKVVVRSGKSTSNSRGILSIDDVIIGENAEVTAIGGDAIKNSCGIWASDITISGSAKVTATGSEATGADGESCGMCSFNGNLTIETAGKVEATGGKAEKQSVGLYANKDTSAADQGNITIRGTGVVQATGGEATGDRGSYGIYAIKNHLMISGSAKVIVKTGTGSVGAGIAGANLLIQEQAAVEVTCGQGGESIGLSSIGFTSGTITGDIEIKGNAKVVVRSGKSTNKNRGISSIRDVIIDENAEVTAISGDAIRESYGIEAMGSITTGGNARVLAVCGKAASSQSIYSHTEGITAAPPAGVPLYVYGGVAGPEREIDALTAAKTYTNADLADPWTWIAAEQPFPVLGGSAYGWTMVTESLKSAASGELKLDMSGLADTRVPADAFAAIVGQDVVLRFDLGNGFVWTVNGKDVRASMNWETGRLCLVVNGKAIYHLDLGASFAEGAIPAETVGSVPAGKKNFQLALKHDGAFPFPLLLTMNVGTEYEGQWSNLYYYNPQSGKLEERNSGQVSGGAATHQFTHASAYLAVLDDHNRFAQVISPQQPGSPEQGVQPTGGNPGTGDPVSVGWLVLLLCGSALAIPFMKKRQDAK